MPHIRVLIGPFQRRVFAEGLASLLRDDPDFEVSLIADETGAARLMDSEEPVVVILEARDDDDDRPELRPRSDSVAVIFLSSEEPDIQIALRQLDRSRLRAAIRLCTDIPPPRVLSLSLDTPGHVQCSLPGFRRLDTSVLAPIIAWLDAVFACALAELAQARGTEMSPAWIGDITHLAGTLAGGRPVSRGDVAARFEALRTAPAWQVAPLRSVALDPQEIRLLCLAAAPDLDHRYAQAVGILQNDYAAPRPNASTLARLLDPDMIGADVAALMAGRRPFARLRAIRKAGDDTPQPGYRAAPVLLEQLIGARRRQGMGWRLQDDVLPAQEALAGALATMLAAQAPPAILAVGDNPAAADEVGAAVRSAGYATLRVDCRALAGDDLADRVADCALVGRLNDAVVLFEGFEPLSEAQRAALFGIDIAGLVRGVIAVGAQAAPVPGPAVALAVPRAGFAVTARRWQAAAGDHGLSLPQEDARCLGGTLRFSLTDIDAVARLAAGRRRLGSAAADCELILEAARTVAARHAPDTVRRPPAIFGWDDIVLPEPVKRRLAAIPGHVRHAGRVLDDWDFGSRLPYGRGVGVLFSGPSGTGKTMCAQVIARALGVDLMQVELSRCVSKYIGETEKNIDRCFVAAEAASAVLLFDEADALFGKRTEIKDAHDRHANVEVAYLLQRIEAYEGLVILTTNFRNNIDAAFLRRLRFCIDFSMPGEAEREEIWKVAIPRAATCAGDVDTAFLARRLPLSGGSIQSIAVDGAFHAAAEGSDAIHMRHLMAATRAELIKNGMFSAERQLAECDRPAAQEAQS